jgi:uncharacterized protein YecE (DUF72 family)
MARSSSAPAGRLAKSVRVGTSGYQYRHWVGVLYPPGLAQTRWFARYAEVFDTVELNTTFYHQPKDSTYDKWRAAAPAGFRYAVKYNRFGSHVKRLADPAEHLARFLSGAQRLGESLGPVLVQLPPRFHKDLGRLKAFLRAAPRSVQWAVEVRHPSWLGDGTYDLLREHGAALVIHDKLTDHPRVLTAPFTYMRFHGGEEAGSYSARQLADAAGFMGASLAQVDEVWAFFNNDYRGHAVRNAQALIALLQEQRLPVCVPGG